MFNEQILIEKIRSLNGRDYGACQSLKGEYHFSKKFRLIIHRIPKDPYAPPYTGIYRIQVERDNREIIDFKTDSQISQIAFSDFLARNFFQACKKISKGSRGTGYSGIITIERPGQCILQRNSVIINDDIIEVRCFLGIPAKGRRIQSKIAEEMLLNELPEIVETSLFRKNINLEDLNDHIHTAVDSESLRDKLGAQGLVAFIANNSILPRESGTSDQPMKDQEVVPFLSPPSLEVELELPHAGCIKGMGIPEGITLITGGGYHGKSTLLDTLEFGIYNHIPGDGREQCVSIPKAVKTRAYSGRNIIKTDISLFIKNLPLKKDTTLFSSNNASGSTSQAASIIEAIEVGAEVLLMDEDTCATNFMNRDKKMQQLIKKEDEPITAFIDKVSQLHTNDKVSTILVLGGVGDYFDVSGLVIQMKNYMPIDVTEEAHEISTTVLNGRAKEDESYIFKIRERIPIAESIISQNHSGKVSMFAKEIHKVHFGKDDIDLTDMEQIVELSQTKAISYALEYSKKYMNNKTTLREVVNKVVSDIEEFGIDVISKSITGNFASFREFELAFTFNRLKSFDIIQKETN